MIYLINIWVFSFRFKQWHEKQQYLHYQIKADGEIQIGMY